MRAETITADFATRRQLVVFRGEKKCVAGFVLINRGVSMVEAMEIVGALWVRAISATIEITPVVGDPEICNLTITPVFKAKR